MNIRNNVLYKIPSIYVQINSNMMEDQIRSFLKDAGRPVTAQDISKETKKTKREVNQVIYKMNDVKKTEDTPPKWMLRGAELPTVSASATSLDVATTKIDFATGMSFDAALSNSPSVPFFDELLKQRIRAVLNESGTTPLTAPQLARKLNDSSIKMVDVKRLLYDIATNVAPNGQKPMWILPENNTGGVTISNLHFLLKRKMMIKLFLPKLKTVTLLFQQHLCLMKVRPVKLVLNKLKISLF